MAAPKLPSSTGPRQPAARRRSVLPLDVETGEKPASTGWLDRLKREARTGIPGAAVSAVLHAAVLIVLALTVIFREQSPISEPLDMGWFTNPDVALTVLSARPRD